MATAASSARPAARCRRRTGPAGVRRRSFYQQKVSKQTTVPARKAGHSSMRRAPRWRRRLGLFCLRRKSGRCARQSPGPSMSCPLRLFRMPLSDVPLTFGCGSEPSDERRMMAGSGPPWKTKRVQRVNVWLAVAHHLAQADKKCRGVHAAKDLDELPCRTLRDVDEPKARRTAPSLAARGSGRRRCRSFPSCCCRQ